MKNQIFAVLVLSLSAASAFAAGETAQTAAPASQNEKVELKKTVHADKAAVVADRKKIREDVKQYGKGSEQVKADRKQIRADRLKLKEDRAKKKAAKNG